MSLINKMLNDLEQRHRSVSESLGPQAGIQPVDTVPDLARPIRTIVIVVLGAAAVGYGAWWFYTSTKQVPSPLVLSANAPLAPTPAEVSPPVGQTVQAPATETLVQAPPTPAAAQSTPAAPPAQETPQPVVVAPTPAPPAAKPEPRPLGTTEKTVTPEQRAESLYREALQLNQRGDSARATLFLVEALSLNPGLTQARLTLAIFYSQRGDATQAIAVIKKGLDLEPRNSQLTLALARLQWDTAEQSKARETLERNLPLASRDPAYQGFYATILQAFGEHEPALKYFLTALQLEPSNPTWLVGIGVSFEALGRKDSARDAYERALATGRLSPALSTFVNQKLRDGTR
jgi:MSHA biogenesis protein MshN